MFTLHGPFSGIATMANLPLRGPLADAQIEVLPNAGLLIDAYGTIADIGPYHRLKAAHPQAPLDKRAAGMLALPGFIDCHTHICFAGTRVNDFALRIAGSSYLAIAQAGGGIWSTVTQTRAATQAELVQGIVQRAQRHLADGITTIEVKSGYGLSISQELKMLRAIQQAGQATNSPTLVPTCLAAHTMPKDFAGDAPQYLQHILSELLPTVRAEKLASRVDIFIEKSAFSPAEGQYYLAEAKKLGFQLTVHADQFTAGSALVAIEAGALSADHLEASDTAAIAALGQSSTAAVALPGASLGLGEPFALARALLDAGAILAIASDWNPGSAPMGALVAQASVLATYQKLSCAEVIAGLTYRAAHALGMAQIGYLAIGQKADYQAYPCKDFREIVYEQGSLKPSFVFHHRQATT